MSQPNRQGQGNPQQSAQGGQAPAMIQPAQATSLLRVLKEQLEQARQCTDPAEARRYYAKVEQIKSILMNYQRQQKAAGARAQGQGQGQAASQAQGSQVAQGQAGGGQGRQLAGNSQMLGQQRAGMGQGQSAPQSQGQSQAMNQQQPQSQQIGGQARGPGMGNMQPLGGNAPATSGVRPQGTIPSSQVTPEKYQQVRQRIQEVEKKIQGLEAAKRGQLTPEQRAQVDSQLTEWRNKYAQFQRFANIIRSQLMEKNRQNSAVQGGSAGTAGQTGAMGSGNVADPGINIQGSASSPTVQNASVAAATAAAQNAAQRPSVTQQNMGGAGSPPMNRGGSPAAYSQVKATSGSPVPVGAPTPTAGAGTGAPGTANSGMGTPAPQGSAAAAKGRESSPAASTKEPGVPGVNLSGITKPSVPSMPISSTINVKQPAPVTLKPGANNVRPTLTGGGASGLGQIMGTPAITRMPTYDMATTSAATLTDNGGRVLTKRKLSELINTIGADEGDGRTTIDGDVEELLLDLADEFISSVTTFACRLAKHRKTDSVDVRDVQLHLERNWNIRIPGYAMDEIRSMRKWQPSSSYNQKVSGVEIAKAINGNMN